MLVFIKPKALVGCLWDPCTVPAKAFPSMAVITTIFYLSVVESQKFRLAFDIRGVIGSVLTLGQALIAGHPKIRLHAYK